MSTLADLTALREKLNELHQNNSMDPEDKDQRARKLRRQIRKMAAELGEPSRVVKSGDAQPRKNGLKKSRQEIKVDHVQVVDQEGRLVERGVFKKSKAERRRERRERRQQLVAMGLGPEQMEYRKPAWEHRAEIAAGLTALELKTLSAKSLVKDYGDGYGYLITHWPTDEAQEPSVLTAQTELLTQLISKFKVRMGQPPEWFCLLQSGPSAIISLGPLPEKFPDVGKRSAAREED